MGWEKKQAIVFGFALKVSVHQCKSVAEYGFSPALRDFPLCFLGVLCGSGFGFPSGF
jgi:hypothetical protein